MMLRFRQPIGRALPIMEFPLNDADLGQRIFGRWRERFGEQDTNGAIRLSIIRGLPQAPSSYYVALLSPGLAFSKTSATNLVATRLKILEPQTDVNLSCFSTGYDRERAFRLVPAVVGPNGKPVLFSDLEIVKRDLVVVRYDDIQDCEIESLALRQLVAKALVRSGAAPGGQFDILVETGLGFKRRRWVAREVEWKRSTVRR